MAETYIKNLGKVCITPEGVWNKNAQYNRLCLVSLTGDDGKVYSYVSRKEVPAGIEIGNTDYWQLVANSFSVENWGVGEDGYIYIGGVKTDYKIGLNDALADEVVDLLSDRLADLVAGKIDQVIGSKLQQILTEGVKVQVEPTGEVEIECVCNSKSNNSNGSSTSGSTNNNNTDTSDNNNNDTTNDNNTTDNTNDNNNNNNDSNENQDNYVFKVNIAPVSGVTYLGDLYIAGYSRYVLYNENLGLINNIVSTKNGSNIGYSIESIEGNDDNMFEISASNNRMIINGRNLVTERRKLKITLIQNESYNLFTRTFWLLTQQDSENMNGYYLDVEGSKTQVSEEATIGVVKSLNFESWHNGQDSVISIENVQRPNGLTSEDISITVNRNESDNIVIRSNSNVSEDDQLTFDVVNGNKTVSVVITFKENS